MPVFKKTIVVNATALRSGGGLTIYRQFISHLSTYIQGNRYYIFVNSIVEKPTIEGVTYICDENHSWLHRIAWEYGGLKKWLRAKGIRPDVIVSLQNTGAMTKCRQVIYYHQSLPFYPIKWSLWKHSERGMWLYKHVYPWFVRNTLNRDTDVVVQIPFIKRAFLKKFNIEEGRVHVLFPDVEHFEVNDIKGVELDKSMVHLVYPASAVTYKEHDTIVEALNLLKKKKAEIIERVKVHFTIEKTDMPVLWKKINTYGLQEQFVWEGYMMHGDLLSLYKSSQGLLFPSIIETLGLPLLEATVFGLPIIAADLDYAHEVLKGYSGVSFIKEKDYQSWADEIASLCENQLRFLPLPYMESQWPKFFELIG